MLTTYGMVLHNADKLGESARDGKQWDIMILDEV